MMNDKPWYLSKTIWIALLGLAYNIISQYLATRGIQLPPSIDEMLFGIAVINGRTANTPISKSNSK